MIHEFTVKILMGAREGTSRQRAEEVLEGLIDHAMFYSIGRESVSDKGFPYIFDYDIEEND